MPLSNTASSLARIAALGLLAIGAMANGAEEGKAWNQIRSDWFGWHMPWGADLRLDTALNQSKRLDAPAGKHGFVTAAGPGFTFEDGNQARFWGACIGYQECMPDPRHAPAMADWIAFNGWNCVREHFFQHIFSADYDTTTHLR